MKPIVLLFFLPSIALAHHGQDFFVTLDSSVPGAFSPLTFSSFEWSKWGDEDELHFESGFLLGIAPGLALGASVGFEDDGSGDWSYVAASPVLQYRIPTGDFPVSFGISAKYSFAQDAEESVASSHDHGENHHGGHDHDHSSHDHSEDESGAVGVRGTADRTAGKVKKPQSAEGHSHGGIHRHGEDYLELRFIAEAPLDTKTRLVGNFIGVVPESGSTDFGYALGIRQEIAHHLELGLEGIGDFDVHGEHEIIFGAYWSPTHQCVLRLGAGTGLGAASSDFSIHTGVTWRF